MIMDDYDPEKYDDYHDTIKDICIVYNVTVSELSENVYSTYKDRCTDELLVRYLEYAENKEKEAMTV